VKVLKRRCRYRAAKVMAQRIPSAFSVADSRGVAPIGSSF
jgi:hypothetical protein